MPGSPKASVIGAGLSGCEAAFFLKKNGFAVDLYEAKPEYLSPAHHLETPAELVCSNSLGSTAGVSSSSALIHETRLMGSELVKIAEQCLVPAGNALAVNRQQFSQLTEQKIKDFGINYIRRNVTDLTEISGPVIIATGPMTSKVFSEFLKEKLLGKDPGLYYFDASAPVITRSSIDETEGFWKGRYQDDNADYFNAVLDRDLYLEFRNQLIESEKTELHEFEHGALFEGCLPIEELALRGEDTMRFGPLKPVGLRFPGTRETPYAVVQLRREDIHGELLNFVGFQTRLKWPEQKRVFRMIPAFKNAEFVRYGVMHRNTFINSPRYLLETMNLKHQEEVFFAGQITGTEGYAEAIACGLAVGLYLFQLHTTGKCSILPETTLTGSLLNHVTKSPSETFQPMKANYGLLKHPYHNFRPKKLKKEKLFSFVLEELGNYLEQFSLAD